MKEMRHLIAPVTVLALLLFVAFSANVTGLEEELRAKTLAELLADKLAATHNGEQVSHVGTSTSPPVFQGGSGIITVDTTSPPVPNMIYYGSQTSSPTSPIIISGGPKTYCSVSITPNPPVVESRAICGGCADDAGICASYQDIQLLCSYNAKAVKTGSAYFSARRVSNGRCLPGSFADPNGKCYHCPPAKGDDGMTYQTYRSAAPVTASDACWYTYTMSTFPWVRTVTAAAVLDGICTGAPGEFYELNSNSCWLCENGNSWWTGVPLSDGKSNTCVYDCPKKWPGSFWDAIDGGTCWSCPPNYERTLSAVNSDSACSSTGFDFRAKRATIGGIFKVPGIIQLLNGIITNDPATGGLGGSPDSFSYHVNTLRDMSMSLTATFNSPANTRVTLGEQIADFKARPGQSPLLRGLLVARLLGLIEAGKGTMPYEQCFLDYFIDYLYHERVFFAEQNLKAFRNWNTALLVRAAKLHQTTAWDFPPDFNSLIKGNLEVDDDNMARTATGVVGIISTLGGIAGIQGTYLALRAAKLAEMRLILKIALDSIDQAVQSATKIVSIASKLAGFGRLIAYALGPLLAAIGVILDSVSAMEQIKAMSDAESKLTAALADAKKPITVSQVKAMLDTDSGLLDIVTTVARMFSASADSDPGVQNAINKLADKLLTLPVIDVTCSMTVDNELQRFYVGGTELTANVVGNKGDWTSLKTISFQAPIADTVIAVQGMELQGNGGSTISGFSMRCSSPTNLNWNFETTVNDGWVTLDNPQSLSQWFGSMANPVGTPAVLSTSGFNLNVQPPLAPTSKIWASSTARTVGFKKSLPFAEDWEVVQPRYMAKAASRDVVVARSQIRKFELRLVQSGNLCVLDIVSNPVPTIAWCFLRSENADIAGFRFNNGKFDFLNAGNQVLSTYSHTAEPGSKAVLTNNGTIIFT